MLEAGGKNELNSYELANVYNLYAFIYYSEEDYDGALRAYRNVIKQPDIPLALEINTRFTVAQLYFVQEKREKQRDLSAPQYIYFLYDVFLLSVSARPDLGAFLQTP